MYYWVNVNTCEANIPEKKENRSFFHRQTLIEEKRGQKPFPAILVKWALKNSLWKSPFKIKKIDITTSLTNEFIYDFNWK